MIAPRLRLRPLLAFLSAFCVLPSCGGPDDLHGKSGFGAADPCGGQCSALQHTACTCGPVDPCGWAGDGACDDVCYTMFPNAHLEDTLDCSGALSPVPDPPEGSGGTQGSAPQPGGTGGATEPGDPAEPAEPGQSGGGGGPSPPQPPDPAQGTCPLSIPGASGAEPGGLIPVCCVPTIADKAAIEEVFFLLNEHRQNNGRSPLTYDPVLEAAIQGHCTHMAQHEFFDHDAPEGAVSSPWDRAAQCGGDAGGENIAWGYQDAQEVMDGWKWSWGHNANMLDQGFTRVGVGKFGDYWGQLFGF